MKKLLLNKRNRILFAMIFLAFGASQLAAQTSPKSDEKQTLVTVSQSTINNCSKAFDELALQDKLIESKESEIKLLNDRLALEKEKSDLIRQIAQSETRRADSLSEANSALREALSAKDEVIKNQSKEITILKNKKPSVFKQILTIAAGVGIGMVLK